MAEAKKAQKPEDPKIANGKGGVAKEKEGEVGGRALILVTCWRCGAGNWIDSNWAYFVCWRDGALCYPA